MEALPDSPDDGENRELALTLVDADARCEPDADVETEADVEADAIVDTETLIDPEEHALPLGRLVSV